MKALPMMLVLVLFLGGLTYSYGAKSCVDASKQVRVICSEGYTCCGPTPDPEDPSIPKFVCCQGPCTKDNLSCALNTTTTTTTSSLITQVPFSTRIHCRCSTRIRHIVCAVMSAC